MGDKDKIYITGWSHGGVQGAPLLSIGVYVLCEREFMCCKVMRERERVCTCGREDGRDGREASY